MRLLLPARVEALAFARRDPAARILALDGATMGTTWSARIAVSAVPPGLCAAIDVALAGIVDEMSHWQAHSALSRFNAGRRGWVAMPPGLFHVVEAGLACAEQTGGAFDPAAGALTELWGFGAAPARLAPPGDDAIATARAAGGWTRLRLDPALRRAFQPGGLRLDLSGIAKGHAVDALAAVVRAHGIADFLVEIGGELRGEGIRPDGQPWWVEIERPPGAALPPARVALHGLSIATSGDYRRWFDHDGVRYGHTLDPRSGRPIANGVAAVTVLDATCMRADALATALAVLGPDDGPAHAARHDVAAAFVIDRGGRVEERLSPAMAAMAA